MLRLGAQLDSGSPAPQPQGWEVKLSPYLQCGQVCLLGQQCLLLLWGIRVVSVLVQPVPQNLDRLLGQIASPPSLARGCRRGKVQGNIHAVFILGVAAGCCDDAWEGTRPTVTHSYQQGDHLKACLLRLMPRPCGFSTIECEAFGLDRGLHRTAQTFNQLIARVLLAVAN